MKKLKTITAIDETLDALGKADEMARKQRGIAIEYTRKVIQSFGLKIDELFLDKREVFRNGAVAACKKLYEQHPGLTRQEYIEKAKAVGINAPTAGTQYSKLKNLVKKI